jgi:hypothetical protein
MKLQIMIILITNILRTSDSKTMNGIVQIYISKTNTLEELLLFNRIFLEGWTQSQTDKLMASTKFSDYLGLKHF